MRHKRAILSAITSTGSCIKTSNVGAKPIQPVRSIMVGWGKRGASSSFFDKSDEKFLKNIFFGVPSQEKVLNVI